MRRLIALLILAATTATFGWAQHEGSHKKEEAAKPAAGDAEAMQEMMAEWAKIGAPGENHAVLDSMVGDWDVDGKFRMSPEGAWMDSPSEARIEWVLGGRFLQQDVSAAPNPMIPQPFHGLGYLGYDNGTGQYVSSWMDTMSTILLTSAGPGADGKIALKGSYFDPVAKLEKNFKWVYSLDSEDQFTLTMREPGADGEMFVNAVLTYRRKAD